MEVKPLIVIDSCKPISIKYTSKTIAKFLQSHKSKNNSWDLFHESNEHITDINSSNFEDLYNNLMQNQNNSDMDDDFIEKLQVLQNSILLMNETNKLDNSNAMNDITIENSYEDETIMKAKSEKKSKKRKSSFDGEDMEHEPSVSKSNKKHKKHKKEISET